MPILLCPLCCSSQASASSLETHLRMELDYAAWRCLPCRVQFFAADDARAHLRRPPHRGRPDDAVTERRDDAKDDRVQGLMDLAQGKAEHTDPNRMEHTKVTEDVDQVHCIDETNMSGALKTGLDLSYNVTTDERTRTPTPASPKLVDPSSANSDMTGLLVLTTEEDDVESGNTHCDQPTSPIKSLSHSDEDNNSRPVSNSEPPNIVESNSEAKPIIISSSPRAKALSSPRFNFVNTFIKKRAMSKNAKTEQLMPFTFTYFLASLTGKFLEKIDRATARECTIELHRENVSLDLVNAAILQENPDMELTLCDRSAQPLPDTEETQSAWFWIPSRRISARKLFAVPTAQLAKRAACSCRETKGTRVQPRKRPCCHCL